MSMLWREEKLSGITDEIYECTHMRWSLTSGGQRSLSEQHPPTALHSAAIGEEEKKAVAWLKVFCNVGKYFFLLKKYEAY